MPKQMNGAPNHVPLLNKEMVRPQKRVDHLDETVFFHVIA